MPFVKDIQERLSDHNDDGSMIFGVDLVSTDGFDEVKFGEQFNIVTGNDQGCRAKFIVMSDVMVVFPKDIRHDDAAFDVIAQNDPNLAVIPLLDPDGDTRFIVCAGFVSIGDIFQPSTGNYGLIHDYSGTLEDNRSLPSALSDSYKFGLLQQSLGEYFVIK